jgi:hypothetical protein
LKERQQYTHHNGHRKDKYQKIGCCIDDHHQYIDNTDVIVDDPIGNFDHLGHQKHKGKKQDAQTKRRKHLFENISVYDGIDFHHRFS